MCNIGQLVNFPSKSGVFVGRIQGKLIYAVKSQPQFELNSTT